MCYPFLQDAIEGEEDEEEDEEEEEETPAPPPGRQSHGQRRVEEITSTLRPSTLAVSSSGFTTPASGAPLHTLQETSKPPSYDVTTPLLGTTSKARVVRQWAPKTTSGQGQCRSNQSSSHPLSASAAVY